MCADDTRPHEASEPCTGQQYELLRFEPKIEKKHFENLQLKQNNRGGFTALRLCRHVELLEKTGFDTDLCSRRGGGCISDRLAERIGYLKAKGYKHIERTLTDSRRVRAWWREAPVRVNHILKRVLFEDPPWFEVPCP